MINYRSLTDEEINRLESQLCSASDWKNVRVAERFTPDYVHHARFSGKVCLGVFEHEFTLPGGICKHSGLSYVTLHNVTVGDNCCIENVKNYIANYEIGAYTFIENVDIILVDRKSRFGNGVEVSVLNETGGREVMIHDRLSAHQAYIMALYRHRPQLIERMKALVEAYADEHASDRGTIGSHVTIVNSGYIKNVRIGDYCEIEGAGRLKNGSINSNADDPVHIGYGVVCDDFIISSGSHIEDGTMMTRCFVGQACHMGHNYSASDSLFFSNCQEENGEACAIFAGPFTVTHHKSTLLIAGMFSFMNAGSGSNQSNHMYKLGPIHQGIVERGSKTTSDSYILWPARIGAFSLVMGRHHHHSDTSDIPFSYLIEKDDETYLVPGINLRSVGTIRDAQKWPKRDKRTDPDRLDMINYNLLSPYTIQKMLKAVDILKNLQALVGETSEIYYYQNTRIKGSSLRNALNFYGMAINKFFGNSLIKRLEGTTYCSMEEVWEQLRPTESKGSGEWLDLAGLILPREPLEALLQDIEQGEIASLEDVECFFRLVHGRYYSLEWTWAYEMIERYYGVDLRSISAAEIIDLVRRWQECVIRLDEMLYEDARKEFSLTSMIGFGVDGSSKEKQQDFEGVRGDFMNNPFVTAVQEHIVNKRALGDELIERLKPLV